MVLAELLESHCILLRLDCRQSWPILSQEHGLHKAFAFLVQVPFLKEVNQGDVEDLVAGDEAVLERHALTDVHHLDLLLLLFHLLLLLLLPEERANLP